MEPPAVLLEMAPASHANLKFFNIIAKAKGLYYVLQKEGISTLKSGEILRIDLPTHQKHLDQALQHLTL